MPQVITDISQVSPAYLTQVLAAVGSLREGRVDSVELNAVGSTWSRMVHIRPRYSVDARGDLPPALLLKMCAGTFGRSEVDYLARDYAHVPDAPIPRCYDAAYDGEAQAYHLLMDDLAATHRNNWEKEPDRAYGEALAEAVAILHAAYWTQDQRRAGGAGEASAEQIARYFAHIRPGLEPLLERVAGTIAPAWRAAIEEIFTRHPAVMLDRLADPHGMTLVHGDLNPGNILSPHEGITPVYLLDRQPFDWSLTTWLGASDLAYAMVHWWPIETRRSCEQAILRRYHDALLARGVENYSWEQLWRDYRIAAVQSVYIAVEWCVLPEDRDKMQWLWLAQLEKALTAYDDLRCFELWQKPHER